VPFAPGYDTVGWFARSAALLERVGDVLLNPHLAHVPASREPKFVLLDDAFALAAPALAAHLRAAAARLGPAERATVFDGRPDDWLRCYQVLQGAQVNASLGAWLAAAGPRFGPAIAARFAGLAAIGDEDALEQLAPRAAIRERLKAMLRPGVVLVLPTTPTTALPLAADAATRGAFYRKALAMNAIAGHAGLPQVTIPAGTVDGRSAGLSFIAARGADRWLLHHARRWAAVLDPSFRTETA
jgi:amidase